MSAVIRCQGKVAFKSWAQAEKTAKRRRANAEADVHPYRCNHCGRVHLGGGGQVKNIRAMQRAFAKYIETKE